MSLCMERDPAPALIPRSPTNVACGLVLAAGALLFVAQGLFEDGGLRAVQDHVITHSFSRQVAETHEYHRDFTYPLPADGDTGPMRRQGGERDHHYAFVNFASMLAADRVAFNSAFHRDAWFEPSRPRARRQVAH